jgi:MerR family transcriptional regulator, thiopeptide resistance regulator
MSFTVGRLARLSGLSVRSLRHYDEIGLLVPSQRSDAGYRLYSDSDIERLYRIQSLRELGWTLAEVQTALADGGVSIPQVLERQIASLQTQIEHATALHARLVHLRDHLSQHRPPEPVEWLAAVELFGHYEKHLSPDELNRLSLAVQGDKEEWRSAYNAATSALARQVAPDSEEAQSIAQRWIALTWRQVGGDVRLALRLKLAYKENAGLRASMSAIAGADPAVMHFIWAAIQHKHVAAFAAHCSKEELQRMEFTDEWGLERARIVGELRDAMNQGMPHDSETVCSLLEDWDCHVDAFVRHDRELKARLLVAMHADDKLQKIWQLDAQLLGFMRVAASSV